MSNLNHFAWNLEDVIFGVGDAFVQPVTDWILCTENLDEVSVRKHSFKMASS